MTRQCIVFLAASVCVMLCTIYSSADEQNTRTEEVTLGTKYTIHSEILGAWQRKSQTLFSTLPSLYLEGLSTRDFDRALSPLWKDTALSPTTISRANEQIKQAFQAWRQRSLKNEQVVYLFLDGHYEGVRLGVKEKEAVLVAHGLEFTGMIRDLMRPPSVRPKRRLA